MASRKGSRLTINIKGIEHKVIIKSQLFHRGQIVVVQWDWNTDKIIGLSRADEPDSDMVEVEPWPEFNESLFDVPQQELIERSFSGTEG